jgi:hypothetical protein
MRQILILTASLLTTCTVDLSKLRPSNHPADAQIDISSRDANPHLDADPTDTQLDLSSHETIPYLEAEPADTQVDLSLRDTAQDSTPDLTPRSPIGSKCSSSSQCISGFCTDNVCCNVAQCVDTCIPNGTTTCAPYNGWTCAPYGTCRGY